MTLVSYAKSPRSIVRALVALIFKPAARYPADPRAIFILALSVFAGLTALLLSAAPNSLDALMPRWSIMVWGALLAVGSALTLIGMLFQSVNGIITEQVGSVMVGSTTVFYAAVAFLVLGVGSTAQPVGIILAWGLSCFVRWIQLQALLNSAYRKQTRVRAEKAVRDQIKE